MSTLKTESIESLDGLYSINTKDIQPIGVGQTWQDMTASRSDNVEYTNNTGRPIQVKVIAVATGSSSLFIVDGVTVSKFDSVDADINTHSAIVPSGSVYKSFNTGASTWVELREVV